MDKEELMQIGKICLRHNVTVVSDEIHCELTYPGHAYTPFASLPETVTGHAVTCISPSKSFNIAGLQIANIVVRTKKYAAESTKPSTSTRCATSILSE